METLIPILKVFFLIITPAIGILFGKLFNKYKKPIHAVLSVIFMGFFIGFLFFDIFYLR